MTLILPKRWSTHDPALLANELERLVDELGRFDKSFALGSECRFRPLPKVNAASGQTIEAVAGFGHFLPVDTSGGGTVKIRLPPGDDKHGGRVCAVARSSTSGVIVVIPPGGTTLNGSTTLTLATTVRLHLFLWLANGSWSSDV